MRIIGFIGILLGASTSLFGADWGLFGQPKTPTTPSIWNSGWGNERYKPGIDEEPLDNRSLSDLLAGDPSIATDANQQRENNAECVGSLAGLTALHTVAESNADRKDNEPAPKRARVQNPTDTNVALSPRIISMVAINKHCGNQNIPCLFKDCKHRCLSETTRISRLLLTRHSLCVWCWKKVLTSEHEMHKRGEHGVKLQCLFCDKQDDKSESITGHIGRVHKDQVDNLSFDDIAQHICANISPELRNRLGDKFISNNADFRQPHEIVTGQSSSCSIQKRPQYGFCPSIMQDFFDLTCLFDSCSGCWGINGTVRCLTRSITKHAICVKCLHQGSEKSHADSCSQQKIACCLCHKPFSSGRLLQHMKGMHSDVDNELIKNEMRQLLKDKLRPEDYERLHESLKITDVTNDALLP